MPIRDRATGALVDEPLPHGPLLRAAYAPGPWAAGLGGHVVSALVGWWARQAWSRRAITRFAESQGVDPTTFAGDPTAFPSLDAFFARVPPPGARPVTPDGLACPCDGRVRAFAALSADAPLPVKGQSTSLRELLADDALADALDGAAALLVRLAPGDLHRVLLPIDGTLGAPRFVGGPLHSVHPVALAAGAPALRNRRIILPLDGPSGPGALVAIGALNVGSVEVLARPGEAARGDEAAAFHLGGSAVVWVGQGLVWDPDLLEATSAGLELRVRQGERVGGWSDPVDTARVQVSALPAPGEHVPGASAMVDPANLVTLLSLGVAWAAMVASLSGALAWACGLLLLCGFLDTVDGFVARVTGGTRAARQVGLVLDSLVDAVAFGLAPAVILATSGLETWWERALLGGLPLAVVARLAAYTVRAQVRRPRRFLGLPSTMTALLVPMAALTTHLGPAVFRPTLLTLTLACTLGMVLPIPLPRGGPVGKSILGVLALATGATWAWLGSG